MAYVLGPASRAPGRVVSSRCRSWVPLSFAKRTPTADGPNFDSPATAHRIDAGLASGLRRVCCSAESINVLDSGLAVCESARRSLHTFMRNTWRKNTMGLLDKIKGFFGGNKDAVKGGIDKVSDVVQSKTPDSIDDKVEMAADKAKDVVEGITPDA